jgi:hypothetical protein
LEQREHKCRYCPGVAFQTKSYLKTHIKVVHKKRRDHACQYCPGVTFGTKSYLAQHINLVHLKLREHALLPRRRLPDEAAPEDAHRDGAREAQGPRVPPLP